MKRIPLLIVASLAFSGHARAQACSSYSPTDIANAISNSSTASSALKNTACTWGGAGKSESGGNTCASNGANFDGSITNNSGARHVRQCIASSIS